MSRGRRQRLWKRVGIIGFCIMTVLSWLVAVYEHRERQACEVRYKEVEKQLQGYQVKETIPRTSEDVREVFVAEAELAGHLQTGDRIDIRIRYFNAEDYLVLADKILVKCDTDSGMVFELSEKEILMLSSAISDCRLYEKTKLYAVAYPEYQRLEAGTVNYIANREIQLILGTETTEGESRTALEQRLEQCE